MEKKVYVKPELEDTRRADKGIDYGSPCKAGMLTSYDTTHIAFMVHDELKYAPSNAWRSEGSIITYEQFERRAEFRALADESFEESNLSYLDLLIGE